MPALDIERKECPKTLTLDLANWKCGDGISWPGQGLGNGVTELLNSSGYMCCLGQFLSQSGLGNFELLGKLSPLGAKILIEPFTTIGEDGILKNTDMTEDLVHINDSSDGTVKSRIDAIRSTLSKAGISLELKNEHLLEIGD